MYIAVISKLKFWFTAMRLINIFMIALASSKEISRYKELLKYLRTIDYDTIDRPNINESALNVNIQFLLYSIRNIDKKSFTYSLAIGTHLWWVDERLSALKVLQPIYVPLGTLWKLGSNSTMA